MTPGPFTQSRGSWLISFTDLLCLLLTFFIMSFSMSEPVYHRWQAMFGTPGSGRANGSSGALFSVAGLDAALAANLDYLAALLRSHLAGEPATAGIGLERLPGEIRLMLPRGWTIPTDGSPVAGSAARTLFVLGSALARIGNRVEVVGRIDGGGDGTEPSAVRFERALRRAVAVAHALSDTGMARRFAVRADLGQPADGDPGVVVVVRDWRED